MSIHTVITGVNIATVLLCGFGWLGMALFLRLRKRKSFVYLLLFTLFYGYIVAVLDFTLFQFQSLLLLNYLSPNQLMLKGASAAEAVNLVPLIMLRLVDLKTSLLNILMLIPFGFGLPFITKLRMKRVVIAGMLFSIAIELLQLLTGVMARMTFRSADINDVIFNTLGAAIGYLLFNQFMRAFRRLHGNRKLAAGPILRYIAARPQEDAALSRKSKRILFAVVSAALFAIAISYAVYPKGDQKEGAIPQSGNLCGDTGGTGEIIRKDSSTITIRRKDGVVQTISLTPQTDIRNAAGPITATDLKIAQHVTLVVYSNDTASTVLVCDPPAERIN